MQQKQRRIFTLYSALPKIRQVRCHVIIQEATQRHYKITVAKYYKKGYNYCNREKSYDKSIDC